MPVTSAGPLGGREPSTELGERFADALVYATRVHRDQTRRGRPYVAHLLRVAGLVLDDGGSEDEAIAALLHDAAEDQGGYRRLCEIRARYGNDVAAIVDSCTDSYEDPKPSWRVRKEQLSRAPRRLLAERAARLDRRQGRQRELDPRDLPTHAHAASDDVCWYYARLARAFSRASARAPGRRAHAAGE